jgi:hypothetical protein
LYSYHNILAPADDDLMPGDSLAAFLIAESDDAVDELIGIGLTCDAPTMRNQRSTPSSRRH